MLLSRPYSSVAKSMLNHSTISYIAWNTGPASGLRKWVIDGMVSLMSVDDVQDLIGQLPVNFNAELLKGFVVKRGNNVHATLPKRKDRCMYHEHAEGETRCQ